jgi:phosphatidylserine decarboxylase
MFNYLSARGKSRGHLSTLLLFFIISVSVFGCSTFTGVSTIKDFKVKHQPAVVELIRLLDARPDLKEALAASIRTAQRPGIPTIEAYYIFLDHMVTAIPDNDNWLPLRLEFFYAIANSPTGKLDKDALFQQWVHKFVDNLGSFLDTTQSAKGLETFYDDPRYRINDYIKAPSGWLTFNQFFARHIKPGQRPVDGLCDDSVIVSPADSVFLEQWKIDENSTVTTKGLKWSVLQLLDGSPYRERFQGGTFIQSYLSPYDYHRFHVPVRGVVKEARKIQGKVALTVYKKEDGSLAVKDELGYQFTQERALIVMESPRGLVAVVPVGMGIVSSVNLTAAAGRTLAKGEEFGYFAFGGSDIIVLFEAAMNVRMTTEAGKHYNQGNAIGIAEKK